MVILSKGWQKSLTLDSPMQFSIEEWVKGDAPITILFEGTEEECSAFAERESKPPPGTVWLR
jgi:hypothetical protein